MIVHADPVRGRWAPLVLTATIVVPSGLAVGVGTQVLQGELPDAWNVVANSGVMWALMAFALGAAMPSVATAAVGGAAEMVIASVSYYQAVEWFEKISTGGRGATIWSAAGVVAGPVFGVAGHVFVRRKAWRWPILALIAGVLLAEGIHLTWLVDNPTLRPAGVIEMLIAAGLVTAGVARSAGPARTVVGGMMLAGVAAMIVADELLGAASIVF